MSSNTTFSSLSNPTTCKTPRPEIETRGVPKADPHQIMQFAKLVLSDSKGCLELRAIGNSNGSWIDRQNEIGFFNDLDALVKAALKYNGRKQIYLGLNPRKPILLHVQPANKMIQGAEGAKAADVLQRTLFGIDIDTERENKRVAATDAEINLARPVYEAIRIDLERHGISVVKAMSGNGRHLVVPTIPYPPDPAIDEKLSGKAFLLLKYFDRKYSTAEATVDLSVFDLPRVWKAYGTVSIKGGNTMERPWRMARFEAPQGVVERVDLFGAYEEEIEEQREIEQREAGKSRQLTRSLPSKKDRWWSQFLGNLATLDIIELFKSKNMYSRFISGNKHAVICPWADQHTTGRDGDSSTVVFEASNKSWPGFKCQHSHCVDKNLEKVLEFFGKDLVDAHCFRTFRTKPTFHNEITKWSERNSAATNTSERDQQGGIRRACFVGPMRPRSEVLFEAVSLLTEVPCYSFGDELAVVHNDEILRIDKPSVLQALLNRNTEFYVGERHRKYVLYPTDHALALLSSRVHEEFQKIRVFAKIPILGSDFKFVGLGYNKVQQIYRVGPDIKAKRGTVAIDAILCEVDFEDSVVDRANFIALLLTALVHHLFPGRVPLLVILANQRGVGKTLLAQILAIIRQGFESPTVTLISNDEELEKRLCTQARTSANLILIDNAKKSKSLEEISSSVLERSITDSALSYRILGKNLECKRINDVQFCLTTNGGKMSLDLISRMLPVRLFYEGDPAGRVFANREIIEAVKSSRNDILSELMGMFEVWREAGMPQAAVQHRFQSWASLIGGVLQANGIGGFLENLEVVKKIADADRQAFSEMAETLDRKRSYTARELLNHAERMGLFIDIFEKYKDERVRSGRFGRELTRFLGEKFTVAGMTIRFVRAGQNADKTALYCFKEMLDQPRNTGVHNISAIRPKCPSDSELFDVPAGASERIQTATKQIKQHVEEG